MKNIVFSFHLPFKYLYFLVLFSILSSCKKDDQGKVIESKSITTENVIAKYHLKISPNSQPPIGNIEKGQPFVRKGSSSLSSTDYDVTQKFPFQTTLYFPDAQAANEFLNYLNYDTSLVTQYYSEHPDFYRRQLYYNGIIKDTTSSLTIKTKCSTCETANELRPMGYSWGSFCQNYMGPFNQICVGMEYDYYSYPQVTDVTPSVSGWELGFAMTNGGGDGYFLDYSDISFSIHFQIALSLFWGGIGTFYSFPPENHSG